MENLCQINTFNSSPYSSNITNSDNANHTLTIYHIAFFSLNPLISVFGDNAKNIISPIFSICFKYALCSYSTELRQIHQHARKELNTSHVLIYPTFLRTFHLYSISHSLIFQLFQTILPTISLF